MANVGDHVRATCSLETGDEHAQSDGLSSMESTTNTKGGKKRKYQIDPVNICRSGQNAHRRDEELTPVEEGDKPLRKRTRGTKEVI